MEGGREGREGGQDWDSLSWTIGQSTPGCEEESERMAEDFTKTRRRSCFLVCISLLVVFGTVLGFLAGLLVGGLLAKHGHFTSVLSQGEEVPVCPS